MANPSIPDANSDLVEPTGKPHRVWYGWFQRVQAALLATQTVANAATAAVAAIPAATPATTISPSADIEPIGDASSGYSLLLTAAAKANASRPGPPGRRGADGEDGRRIIIGGSAAAASGQSAIQFKDEGSSIGTSGAVTAVDFTGAGVTASHSSGTVTVAIAGGGGTSMIASTTLGSAGGTITVSGLDLTTHKLYQVRVRLKNNSAVTNYVYLRYNGVTTATDYYAQIARVANTTHAIASGNDGYITYLLASDTSSGTIEIMHDFNNKASATTAMRSGATTTITRESFSHIYKTAGNITSLSLTCASNFAVGSSVEVWA